jgi:putative membrane protein
MKTQFVTFLIRWLANCLGIYVAGSLFGLVSYQGSIAVIVIGGFLLSLLNALVKPLIIIFTLPAIALTLGLFLVVINGFIVYLLGIIYESIEVQSFWSALLVGIIIGLINYLITILTERFFRNG